MAESENAQNKLYTLSEISQRTGISMPTLQRYKKLYQGRIPSEGKGRKQRYPESALPVFEELKVENAGRRGRPRKDASAPRPAAGGARRGRKPAAAPVSAKRAGGRKAAGAAKPAPAAARRGGRKAAAASASGGGRAQRSGNLLTLTQVSEQTGISYPTLVRYVRVHSNKLPSEGTGRSRRFHPEAVDVFRQLRSESGRGGRKPAAAKTGRGPGRPRGTARAAAASGAKDPGTSNRLKALERAQQDLEKRFRGFVQSLQKLFR
ncbi:MAG TPA: helix-turn-helix domain-containing protein [Thermoanaerobaculia bacterium]|nr:helix-turn-helix domain-containing protein [Thermoanaerobaculia bacterium]